MAHRVIITAPEALAVILHKAPVHMRIREFFVALGFRLTVTVEILDGGDDRRGKAAIARNSGISQIVRNPHRALIVMVWVVFAFCVVANADPVPARLKQGVGHIFLLVLDESGKTLAAGESQQTVKGYTVTTRTTFHFRDGSLDDETTVFEQRVNLRVLSDDHLQRGPAFPHPMEIRIEAVDGRVIVHDLESGKTETHTLKIPFDLANGIVTQVLQNIPQDTAETKVSYVLPTSKPRLATLVVSRAGEGPYTLGGEKQTAKKLEIKVDLGGLAGLIAPVIGKEPKPTYAWMAGGHVPMFIRIQTQFYEGAPLWTIQQTAPEWPSEEK